MINQRKLPADVVLRLPPVITIALVTFLVVATEWASAAKADEDQSFEDFKNQRERAYDGYAEEREREFREYQKKIKQAFSDYKAKAARVWGDDNTVMPDKHRWVEYQDQMKERRVVDFERGTGEVAIAVDSENPDWSGVRERLTESVVETITQGPDVRSITEIAENPDDKQRQGDPLLEGQIKNEKGEQVGRQKAREFAESRVRKAELNKETVKGQDGKERVAVKVTFELLPNHVQQRAQRYKDLVLKRAESRNIKPQLVFALIETESSYNPKARSPIPAFGLMQLVPGSGARDAYQFIYDEDKLLTDTYLYDPQNNVKLGVAYIDKIFKVYFDEIEDELSRQWCSVAAYNTGVGNVFRTFAGKYSSSRYDSRSAWRKEAFHEINKRSPREVFHYLKANLPYEETQNYIVKIRKRMPKYKAF